MSQILFMKLVINDIDPTNVFFNYTDPFHKTINEADVNDVLF